MIAALRRRLRDDRGLSLVEVLVSMLLTGIVMALAMSFFAMGARTTTEATTTRTVVADTVTLQNAITSRVRVAAEAPFSATSNIAFARAEGQAVQFYSWSETPALAPRMSRVTIAVTANRVTVSSCPGTQAGGFWTFPCSAAATTSQTFQNLIVAPATGEQRLFTYRDRCGVVLGNAAGTVPSTDYSRIQTVEVSVKSKTPGTADATAVYLTTPVYLTNIASTGVCP